MVILEKEEIFELVTVPSNVIGDLVASEGMCLSVIVVKLIGQTAEEAVPVSVHAVDVGSVGEERHPELLNAWVALGRRLTMRYHRICQGGWDTAVPQVVVQSPSLTLRLAAKFLQFHHRKCFAACLRKLVIDLHHCTHVHFTNLSKHLLRNGALIRGGLCP